PYSPWQNKAEIAIRELKKHFRRIMNRARAPEGLWDFCLEYVSDIRIVTSRVRLDDRTPYEVIKGETPDISELLYFEFYQWVKFHEPHTGFTEQRMVLGRWLGIAHDIGQAMSYWILKDTGRVIVRSTVRSLTDIEILDAGKQERMRTFTTNVHTFIGEFDSELVLDIINDDIESPEFLRATFEPTDDVADVPVPDTGVGFDPTLNAEVILPRGDRNELAKIVERKRNSNGNLVGWKHQLPQLDSRQYTGRKRISPTTSLQNTCTRRLTKKASNTKFSVISSIIVRRKQLSTKLINIA
ncbi:MAG: hypothetical protein ACRDL7_08105, partial [Gaiellaceae bacterium]